jgi:F-type H+-transporting ATPase subunit b
MTFTISLALIQAASEIAAVPEPKLLGLDAEGWVYVGLTIFLLLAIFVAKAPKKITEALDARIADTRKALDEAQAIRAEAEKLLASAKAKTAAVADETAAIVAQAESEAKSLIAQAEVDVAALIGRRSQAAQDKIAAAERAAVADVRARAADASTAAARKLISEGHAAAQDSALVDQTISALN